MKLRALRLWNVRKFANRGVAIENIGDGVNVFSAENESGKSTSFDALHALFFQPYSGTPKAVQLLRPYSGGSPQIEIDIEISDGLFRINKQYYNGRHAVVTELATDRIVAQADDAEAWIADLVRGGASGPAGLLWVQQGITGIGGRSSREKNEERKVREDALTSITGGEIEMLTGGRRMIRVLRKTISALDELVTSNGKAKKGGPYFKAVEEQSALLSDEKKLKIQLDELRGALDSRRKKKKLLKEFNEPEAIRQRRRDEKKAHEALEKARMHSDKLARAAAEENLAREKHRMAVTALNEYSRKLEMLARLAKEITDDEVSYEAALKARDEALAADNLARNALEKSEKNLDLIRLEQEAAKKAQDVLDAASGLKKAEERLRKVEKLQGEIEALQAEHDALAIPEGDLSEFEELERNIEVLKARVRAKSVTFEVNYIAADHPAITCNGMRVDEGKSQEITGLTVFEIPDIGRLTVSPGSGTSAEDLQKDLREAQNGLKKHLARFDLENVLSARERVNLANKKLSALKTGKMELGILVPEGVGVLRRHCAGLKLKAGASQPEQPDIKGIEARLEAAIASWKKASCDREAAREELQSVQDAFIGIEAALNNKRAELARIKQELGAEDERAIAKASLQKAVRKKTGKLSKAEKNTKKLQSSAPDLENATAAFKRSSSAVARAGEEIAKLEKDIAELDGGIAISAGQAVEEIYEETKGRRKAADARVDAFNREIAALLRLKQVLEDARAAAKEQYFGPVMAELKPLLTLLLDEASITFDDETLLPQTLVRDGLNEDIAVLSGGMREQLAILTRLAFARLLAKGGNSVPVILDDALVYSDDDRIERMFNALHRQANDLQILVFTCRQRAFKLLGGNGLGMSEWTPPG